MNVETLQADSLDQVLLFKTLIGAVDYMTWGTVAYDNVKFYLNAYKFRMTTVEIPKLCELVIMFESNIFRYCLEH